MSRRIIKILFYIGLALFVAGFALVFIFNRTGAVGVGIMSLGIMWSFVGFGQLRALGKK